MNLLIVAKNTIGLIKRVPNPTKEEEIANKSIRILLLRSDKEKVLKMAKTLNVTVTDLVLDLLDEKCREMGI